MPISTENTVGEHLRLRKPRNQQEPISVEADLSQLNSSSRPSSKPTTNSAISSLFLSHFASSSSCTADLAISGKKKGGNAFLGLGCKAGAAQQVSVPTVIRASAEWDGGRRVKKKKKKNGDSSSMQRRRMVGVAAEGVHSNLNSNMEGGNSNNYKEAGSGNCMVAQDVWCGPGIGFTATADAVVGPVDKDCLVPRRVAASSGRGNIDGEKFITRERERERDRDRETETETERERAYCFARHAAVNPDAFSFWDTDSPFVTSQPESEVFGSRYYHHVRHPSPDGLAEMMMLQSTFMMGGRVDRFSDWRLDIDHMTYEQLLELGDRIGFVNTGLKEEEIGRCIRKMRVSVLSDQSTHLPLIREKKCSICQEEYEADDELGKLNCGHGFHIQCIKQWLRQKNSCPVCKTAPAARS